MKSSFLLFLTFLLISASPIYSQKTSFIKDTTLARQYSDKAEMFMNADKYDSAVIYYGKAADLYKNHTDWKNKSLVAIDSLLIGNYIYCLSMIGSSYYILGKFNQALEYFNETLSIRLIVFSSNNLTIASSYNNLGAVYDQMAEYDEALEYYRKSLVSKRISVSENHPSVASSYNNIGCTYSNKGDYDKALSYHKKALAIRINALG